jgi:hypothetical protein
VNAEFSSDGGESLVAKVNGKVVCESKAIYGASGSAGGMGGMRRRDGPHSSGGWKTISEMSQCYGPIKISKGSTFELEAKYDLIKHPASVFNSCASEAVS